MRATFQGSIVALITPFRDGRVDEAKLRKRLLVEHNIEVGAGLGSLKGKIIRVGLMGETSKREKVEKFLSAFREIVRS